MEKNRWESTVYRSWILFGMRQRMAEEIPLVNKKMKKSDSFEYYLIKKVGKTVKKYGLIERGDKILVGVSGGKDSLTLLKILHDRKGFYPSSYEYLALHVVSNIPCEGSADPNILERHFQENEYPYRILHMNIEENRKGPSAFWCSHNRRRVLFEMAKRWGYNKIALGHHRNDVLETVLLNMFYHAEISTMLPVQSLFNGSMAIIRPLYNIPESDTRKFARIYNFPVAHCRCPTETETKREMFKRVLRDIERSNPRAAVNALRALENVREEYLPISVIKEKMVI
jgi:tRNA 2-thiocytidine biosynthesis protein TtcA